MTVRRARKLVAKGQVLVNGERCQDTRLMVDADTCVAVVMRNANPGVRAALAHIEAPPPRDYYLKLCKPRGVVCSHRRAGPRPRPVVKQLYPVGTEEALHAVGRLDGDSEGLLLLTSDGCFTRFACMPEVHLEKEYIALVDCARDCAPPQGDLMRQLLEGVNIADGEARASAAEVVDFDGRFARIRIVVTEGRFHMVRRMLRAIGYGCLQLFRTRIGGITGADIAPVDLSEAAHEAWQRRPAEVVQAWRGDPAALQPGEYADVAPEQVSHIYSLGLSWLDSVHPVV